MSLKENNANHRGKRALVLGNGKYTLERNRLGQTKSNCNDMKKALEEIGFGVKTAFDLSKLDMIDTLQKFTETIHDGDLVLFYYFGHACHVNGKNVLVPVDDSKIGKNEDLLESDFAIDLGRQVEMLKKATPSYTVVCILDCCEPYFLSNVKIDAQGLRPSNGPDGVLIQYSSSTDRISNVTTNTGRHSLFTKYLLENIIESDVHVADMLRKVTTIVWRQTDGTQRPVMMNKLEQFRPVYLNEEKFTLLNIDRKATWKSVALTVAGGFSIDEELADMIDVVSPRVASSFGLGPSPLPRRPALRHPPLTFPRLNKPERVCVDNKKTLFIADGLNHRIMAYEDDDELYDRMAGRSFDERILWYIRYSKRGKMVAGKTITGCTPGRLAGPSDVIYDVQSKKLIIADYHNRRVLRWSPNDRSHPEIITENIECRGLTIDSKGSLYVSDTERHEVRCFEHDDKIGTVVAGGHGQGGRRHQLNHPTYICIGPNDALYISDSGNDRVMKYEKGAHEGVVVAGGHGKGLNMNQLDHPAGLAVDRLGTVYVADYWNHRVMRWYSNASEGDRIAGVRRPGDNADQLNGPEGIAFDKDGNLYVADSDNHRIQRFDLKK